MIVEEKRWEWGNAKRKWREKGGRKSEEGSEKVGTESVDRK
jgi:hypothetical protein